MGAARVPGINTGTSSNVGETRAVIERTGLVRKSAGKKNSISMAIPVVGIPVACRQGRALARPNIPLPQGITRLGDNHWGKTAVGSVDGVGQDRRWR